MENLNKEERPERLVIEDGFSKVVFTYCNGGNIDLELVKKGDLLGSCSMWFDSESSKKIVDFFKRKSFESKEHKQIAPVS